jgi:hypothetical protein
MNDGLLDMFTDWTTESHAVLADLGYEGENTRLTVPIRTIHGRTPTAEQRTINTLHSATRALAERGNSLLKTTSAPRGAVMYPPRSGERLEEVSLDLMASPELERERGR